LTTILSNLGFENITLTDVETFSAGTYNITLYAEFAGWHYINELSYYELSDQYNYIVIFSGPEGASESGYVVPPLSKLFTADDEFGLSMLSNYDRRYFTENYRNGDGKIHSVEYENLDDPGMYLIGFENTWGGGDQDYNDMVFSLKPYAPTEYTLTVNVVGSGSVAKSPDLATYSYGTVVELTANPSVGWSFSHWSGDASGSVSPTTVTMTGDKTVTATFTQEAAYTLTITTTTGGTTSPSPGDHVYSSGTNVPVTAIPKGGYQFDHWELDSVGVGSANPYTVTMSDDHTLHAVFKQAPSPPPAVGGYARPITLNSATSNSFIPHMGLASILSALVTATIMLVRRRKKTLKREH